jgi:hypothetical protein
MRGVSVLLGLVVALWALTVAAGCRRGRRELPNEKPV